MGPSHFLNWVDQVPWGSALGCCSLRVHQSLLNCLKVQPTIPLHLAIYLQFILQKGYHLVYVSVISPPEKTKFTSTPLHSAARNHSVVILYQDLKDLFVKKSRPFHQQTKHEPVPLKALLWMTDELVRFLSLNIAYLGLFLVSEFLSFVLKGFTLILEILTLILKVISDSVSRKFVFLISKVIFYEFLKIYLHVPSVLFCTYLCRIG